MLGMNGWRCDGVSSLRLLNCGRFLRQALLDGLQCGNRKVCNVVSNHFQLCRIDLPVRPHESESGTTMHIMDHLPDNAVHTETCLWVRWRKSGKTAYNSRERHELGTDDEFDNSG